MNTDSPADAAPLDFIEELRLRRWARVNYVPQKKRSASWHPVVIEEMRRKDVELIIHSRSRQPASSFVPLAPAPIQHLHARHSLPVQPNLLPSPSADAEQQRVRASAASGAAAAGH